MRRDMLVIDDPDADCVKIPRCHLLDAPSEPHPFLDVLMRDELLGMHLLSGGRAANLAYSPEKRTKGERSSGAAPTSTLARDIDELSYLYARCRTHRERLWIIYFAQRKRRSTLAGPAREKVNGTAEWREAIAAAAGSCRMVARLYGCSPDTVSRIRREGVRPVAESATVSDTTQAA